MLLLHSLNISHFLIVFFFFFFKQKTAYEMLRSLVGSEMCIRDRIWTSMSVLDFSVKLRISPVKLRKVGAIIKNMQTFSGITFTDDNINDVVRALFVDQSDDNMLKAFSVFDPEGTGVLDGNSFKEVLPLLGEKVPPEEIDALFDEVDADGSGQIEIDEFTVMIKRMNPPE
eukprot:TRINITY_DN7958_c0_g1_i4.p2 TRINITY_DN7958_c0_g1~~TRINITY_DN7958_c0_g1_i4.p2  ORF type:complete len:171 (-),score=64.17 TRINITY_DN7958_c0_g1_i4:371-883(-)